MLYLVATPAAGGGTGGRHELKHGEAVHLAVERVHLAHREVAVQLACAVLSPTAAQAVEVLTAPRLALHGEPDKS